MSAVARRYAKALFELATERKEQEQVAGELERVAALVANPALATVWNNPRLQVAERHSLVSILEEQLGLGELCGRFLHILADARRLREIPAIYQAYQTLLDESLRRTRAVFRSAHPLDEATVDRLRARFSALTQKEVIVRTEVDPGLLGGIVVEIEGKTFDGSVRTQLERLATRLTSLATY